MIQAGGDAGLGGGAGFDESKVLAFVLDPGGPVHGQVTDVEFVEEGIGDSQVGIGVPVGFPALGVGGSHIDDHCTEAVDTGGFGIGVTGFHTAAVPVYQIGIVNTVYITKNFCQPGAIYTALHGNGGNQIFGAFGSGAIEIDSGGFRGGGPKTEGCFFLGPGGTQVIALVGELCFKFGGREDIGHKMESPSASNENVFVKIIA